MKTALSAEQLKRLEQKVGHRFHDVKLLTQALTHSSATADTPALDYERLEFLGDRVLALLAAEALMETYAEADEGGLAARLNALVRKEACAQIAVKLDLGSFLILGEAERGLGFPGLRFVERPLIDHDDAL